MKKVLVSLLVVVALFGTLGFATSFAPLNSDLAAANSFASGGVNLDQCGAVSADPVADAWQPTFGDWALFGVTVKFAADSPCLDPTANVNVRVILTKGDNTVLAQSGWKTIGATMNYDASDFGADRGPGATHPILVGQVYDIHVLVDGEAH